MRRIAAAAAFILMATLPAAAQDWAEYQNNADGFKLNFPGQPKVTEGTWKSEYGYMLPERIYSVDRGKEHYSMTVVDYTGIEKMGLERQAKCPAGAETCQGQRVVPGAIFNIGPGYSTQDIRGALVYASYKFLQRDAKLTAYLWNWEDLVEGHQIQLTNNADQSRTFAFVAMHRNKLYMMEGTVPKGYPEPGLFQQSLGWVDKDGNGIRYQSVYSNEIYGLGLFPEPPHNGGGFQGAGGARGGGAAPAPAPGGGR